MSLLSVLLVIFILIQIRSATINYYKMCYYKQKLINRDVDISSVENFGLIDIFKD